MLNEIDSVEELAVNITGTRPLLELKAEDVLAFEREENTNVEMPTDRLKINFSERSTTFKI